MPRRRKGSTRKGLEPRTYQGLSKKRMAKKSQLNILQLEKGKPTPVQFLETPDEMLEFDQHQFQDDGWKYVPCLGDGCPLCDDESEDVSRIRYRFCCNVYSLADKKVLVLEGPKDMAGRIAYQYGRRPKNFLKRVFEITKFDTQPVSYQVELGEDRPINPKNLKTLDLTDYVADRAKFYFGQDVDLDKSALDDDDEYEEDDDFEDEDDFDDDEEEEYTKKELRRMSGPDLKDVAREFGVRTKGKSKNEVIEEILEEQEYD